MYHTYIPDDFIEVCLHEIEGLLLREGWDHSSYSFHKNPTHKWDLERAVERIAKNNFFLANDYNYPDLNEMRTLSAELKAYLSTFMPEATGALASLSGFNNSNKTQFIDVLEVLELAREAWRPEQLGYRDRHNRNEYGDTIRASNTLINITHP